MCDAFVVSFLFIGPTLSSYSWCISMCFLHSFEISLLKSAFEWFLQLAWVV